jgi:transcriptional regulator with XRE-family HTH domain
MSQEAAARRAGIAQGQWSRIEAGRGNPTLGSLVALQNVLGVDSLESLFGLFPSRDRRA